MMIQAGRTTLLRSVEPLAQHWNCRCLYVEVLKTWKELGIDLNEMPASTRASMDGQVKDTSFGEWLKGQSPARQEEILGKGRADLYNRGVITFNQLTDGKGAPLSLKQLQDKYL